MRITQKDLEDRVDSLNELFDHKLNFVMTYAYGDVRLGRMGGNGLIDVLPRTNKPQQYALMYAIIEGMRLAKEVK